MPELDKLNHQEKVFLAGCMESAILADGEIEETEIRDLDRIYKRLQFHDYDQCLQEFEANTPDRETFYESARKITNPEAQDIILQTVYELMRHSGAPSEAQEKLFNELSDIWKRG
jgi:hypothetical protein